MTSTFRNAKVVKPSWIVDSIAQNLVLPWREYQLLPPETVQLRRRGLECFKSLKSNIKNMEDNITEDRNGNTFFDVGNVALNQANESNIDEYDGKGTLEDETMSSWSDDRVCQIAECEKELLNDATKEVKLEMNETAHAQDHELLNEQCYIPEIDLSLIEEPEGERTFAPNSAANPEFIQSFYHHSRLHHLSTWRLELQRIVSELYHSLSISKATVEIDPADRVVMHVDLDCFFASVAELSRPELTGKPIGVCSVYEDPKKARGASVASCNYAARAHGVCNGMMISTALECCPDLVVVPYEFESYRCVTQTVYTLLMKLLCWKEGDLLQAVSCDEVLLSFPRRKFGNDTSWELGVIVFAEDIRHRIKLETRCMASVGIASNILLAR